MTQDRAEACGEGSRSIRHLTSNTGNASFLVRIWWESREQAGDPAVWRGRVEHVPSGCAAYFDETAGLLAFLERWTGELSGGQPDSANEIGKEA